MEYITKLKNLSLKTKIISGSILVLLLLVWILFPSDSGNSAIPEFTVKRGSFLVSITESGEINAVNSVSVSTPRIRGNLKIVYLIPQGTYVQPGDTVVRFDPTEAVNEVREKKSALEVSLSEREKLLANHKTTMTRMESDLKSAELSYQLSKLNLETMKFEAAVKQQEAQLNHQRNELSYLKAKQEVESQKIIQQSELNRVNIEIQQKNADFDRAQLELDRLTLVAPSEGLVVYSTNWNTGRKVAVGDTPWGGMTIITLPDLSLMQSSTSVNEVDVSRVSVGQKVVIALDAFQDSSFYGTISNVASLGANKSQNSTIKVFDVEVAISGVSPVLKPGMTTSNKIIINEIQNVISVPLEALFDTPEGKVVYVKNGSGYEPRKIVAGEKSDDFIIITSGLKEKEVIALRNPFEELTEDDKSAGGAATPEKKAIELPQ